MANEQFVSRYRKYGEEQPYWKAGIFKIRLPFVHYKWSVPEMVQAVFMCATCLGAIPVLQEVLGVSYGVALSMVIINGFFYNLHVLLGDPVVPGWITPAIPIITAFLTDGYEMGPERTQALIAMQLILGLIFLVFGITGIGGKMVHLVPNSVKAGVLMGGGLAAIIGEMGETGRFWTYPISITVGVLVAYFCLFSPIWANLRRKYKAIDLIGKFGMLPAIIIGVVLGPIVKEIAVPAVQLWPLIKIPEFGNIWNQLSPFAIGWPSAATWIAAIPTAIVVYIIAFGDFVTSEELLRSADEVRQDEKIDFNANRSNVISGIRNVAMALCCPYTQTCGPLWAAVTAAVSQRYKGGPQGHGVHLLRCRYLPLVYLYLRGPDPHLLPATARAACSPVPDPDRAGLHLHPTGHEHVPHRHRAGYLRRHGRGAGHPGCRLGTRSGSDSVLYAF